MKFKGCTLPSGSTAHLKYHIRVITRPNAAMPQYVLDRLDCKNEKTILHGTDLVCEEVTDWQLMFGSTSVDGRCPQCEQECLYPGMCPVPACLEWSRALT